MNTLHRSLLALALAAIAGQAAAQHHGGHGAHAGQADRRHDHHAGHAGHAGSGQQDPARQAHAGHESHAVHGAPVASVPPLTDADRAAAFPALQRHMEHARELNSYLLFNRLEAWDADHGSGQAWEARGWIGSDLNRLWLRSEGERAGGRTEAADIELLYGRSVSAWWDVVAGVRHDFAPGDSRTWAAVGVQGLAPYLFEVAVTGYVGESGQTALAAEVEYELLLTNRLVLQPMLEATAHGKDQPARDIGSGLSSLEAGLRLRYEINRHFAPYIGLVHERSFGDTAGFRRAHGESSRDTRVVLGARIWF